MADPLSIVASVLTIISSVNATVSAAKGLYAVPQEYEGLSQDLSDLERTLQSLSDPKHGYVDAESLSRAQKLVVQVHGFIIRHIKSKGYGSVVCRVRLASQIATFRKLIREAKGDLAKASSVMTLSIQHQSSRQIDTIGQNLNQLIAQQTVLLDRLNMSTENAIASPEKMHYILAHALRTDRHFMVENRQKLKYLFTITDCNREIFRAVTTSLNDPEWNFKLEVVAHTRQRTPRSRPSGGQTVEKSFKSLISSFVFFSNELDFWRRSPVLSRYGIRLYLREGSLAASYASISLPWGLDGSRNDITLKIQTWNSLCHDLLQDVPDPLRAFSPSGSFQELSKLDSYVQISFELGSW